MSANMQEDIKEVLISEEEIRNRVRELGAQITADYTGKEPFFVGVLRGCFVFMSDLVRAVDLPCTMDFMAVSSYGNGTTTTGAVKITRDLTKDIEGKDVIIVEDILDSGNTLSYLKRYLLNRKPASIRLVTLLDKPDRHVMPIRSDYIGFSVPDEFVVGYGLDFAEGYRNLPYIGVLKPEVYTKQE